MTLLIAVGTAYFRDVRHFVDVGLAILFWATPVVYETTQLSPGLQRVLLLTPLSHWSWFFAYVGSSVARGGEAHAPAQRGADAAERDGGCQPGPHEHGHVARIGTKGRVAFELVVLDD